MNRLDADPKLASESIKQGAALAVLLGLGAFVTIGPSGLLAWGENNRLLAQRHQQIAQLTAERDQVKNRVSRLDPRQVDPDLAGELLRSNLNVVHPDEMVILLDK